MKKRLWQKALILILCINIPLAANATTISDIKKQQSKTQQQLEEANENIENLTEISKGITEEIEAIDDEIVVVMTSISMIEDEIVETEDKIEVAKVDLENAIAEEEKQYDSMKARIKYMYEKGDSNYIQMVFESQSTAELGSKEEYVDKLYQYDRKKLEEFIAAKEAVDAAKQALEEHQEELQISMNELQEEKSVLDDMLAEKKAEQEDYDLQLAKAKQDAAAYKAKIKQQNAQIKKIQEEERKKAEAAAKAAAEAAAKAEKDKEKGDGDDTDIPVDTPDTPTPEEPTPVVPDTPGNATGKQIADYACKFVGNPYVAGGTSLTNGADCSGFTFAVYKDFGYSIPRTSTSQRSAGRGVTYAEAQPGDIICYAGHVALYIGNGKIVHASTPSTGIKYGDALYKEILAVRRIV